MKKQRLTIEGLQSLPKDAFPLEVESDIENLTHHLKKIKIMSHILDGYYRLSILDNENEFICLLPDMLSNYPSIKTRAKIVRFWEYLGLVFGKEN